ncbi:siroheme synthase [Bacillus luteolus]|uniref:precorrin-2 dehydrogenase n=1 Tax=Litchfieldia luteola TaxID=682179 RepID=A0ABR9QQ50_9BACI|nr:NAD(P)-dependent oxidoreductase [Cytobacillus luteolus]MBE4910622.1 siroheme synthase [Cytobacillus luteolus]MBP1943801.1 precorrin-2 dehydrogenase/sirohydrochlorin ferrochelatase [Cytobacillus luteolus]
MKRYYPIMLDLDGKQVVVVGGGKVAERKVLGLLEANANVTIISPTVTEGLSELVQKQRIQWKEKTFESKDLTYPLLVFGATNNKSVNKEVRKAAEEKQLLCLLVDSPLESDFQVPSTVTRGRLQLTISTSGASPTLAKKIKQELENKYDESYESFVDFLFDARQKIINEIEDPAIKSNLLTAIIDKNFYENSNRKEMFEELLKQALK